MFRTITIATKSRSGSRSQLIRNIFRLSGPETFATDSCCGITLVNFNSLHFIRQNCTRRSLYTNTSKKNTNNRKVAGSGTNIRKKMADETGWCTFEDVKVHAWSISGLESCITVMADNFSCAFDMGYPTRPSVKCPHVFISHGHIDHVSGVVQHSSRRELYSMKPATYYMPDHLVKPIQTMAESFAALHGPDQTFTELNIKVLNAGDTVTLSGGHIVRAFPTVHRVSSQGYIIYQQQKRLKEEYQGLPGVEIGQLVRQGVAVNDIDLIPLVAYTGDTTFELFLSPPHPDLLKVKLLITEATYIDKDIDKQGKTAEQRARSRGHSHLQEIVDNWELFENVDNILLVHFSDKYPTRYIQRQVDSIVPEHIKPRIHLGTLMKSTLG